MKRYNITSEKNTVAQDHGVVTTDIKITEADNGEWIRYEDAFHTDHTRREFDKPFIVCAANRSKVTGVIVTGARHFDKIMHAQITAMIPPDIRDDPDAVTAFYRDEGWRASDQGFIDQWGNFYHREAAWLIAWENKQVARITGSKGTLFSEDLY